MKRRDFIKLSLLSASTLGLNFYSVPTFGMGGKSRNKLIYIFLKGGADPLSIFPPSSGFPRPQIKNVIKYNAQLGIHPLLDLENIRKSKHLQIFTHIGVDPKFHVRSHFEQIEQIERGYIKDGAGFFSRHINNNPNLNLKAVAIGGQIPDSLLGADVPLITKISDLTKGFDAGVLKTGRSERLELFKNNKYPESRFSQTAMNAINNYDALAEGYSDPAKYSSDTFVQACQAAAMLSQSPGNQGTFDPSIMTIDFGGWDDHISLNADSETSEFSNRVKKLNDGLKALYEGMSENTLVVVMSEFGRTININNNGGTDHG
jgi:uncharacterized protein (DUF1501 family)